MLFNIYGSKKILVNPVKQLVASISVGIYKGHPVLDLDYDEDSKAETDMNIVMTEHGGFIEFRERLNKVLLRLANSIAC